jgi:hypothetical protein
MKKQRQPRLLSEYPLTCPQKEMDSGGGGVQSRGGGVWSCPLRGEIPDLTAGDGFLKFDLMRNDGTKAATARAGVSVRRGGGHGGGDEWRGEWGGAVENAREHLGGGSEL